MKLKKTLLTSALMTVLTFTAQAAQELTPEKAASLPGLLTSSFGDRNGVVKVQCIAVQRSGNA